MTTNRFSLIVAAFVIAALAVLTISSMSSLSRKADAAKFVSRSYDQIELARAARYESAAAQQAYMDQRHGEQTAGQVSLIPQTGLSFRQAEQLASAADAQHAYIVYREGEWNAGVSPDQAYLNYRRGEWSGK